MGVRKLLHNLSLKNALPYNQKLAPMRFLIEFSAVTTLTVTKVKNKDKA